MTISHVIYLEFARLIVSWQWVTEVKLICINNELIDGKKIIKTKALIDSGTQGIFMDERFAEKHQLPLLRLNKEIQVSNVDESPNKNGPIRFHT